MKVRGSLKIDKDLILTNPNGTTPSKGLVAVSDDNGKVKWSHLVILPLDMLFTYPDKGSLIIHTGKVYYSLVNRARGIDFENPYIWKELNKDGVSALTQDQLDAIYAANFPSTDNPFITLQALLENLTNIQLEGDVTGETRVENGRLVIDTTFVNNELLDGKLDTPTGTIDQYLNGVGVPANFPLDRTDKTFRFSQGTPSSLWSITHNLNKYPSVTIMDTSGSEYEGEIKHLDENNLTIEFSVAVSGSASLN